MREENRYWSGQRVRGYAKYSQDASESKVQSRTALLQIWRSGFLIQPRNQAFMKRTMLLMGGMLWLCFAVGIGVFLVQYIGGGAGLQFFGGPVSSGSVLLGLVHVVGFGAAILLCFAIGVGLCANGIAGDFKGAEGTERKAMN